MFDLFTGKYSSRRKISILETRKQAQHNAGGDMIRNDKGVSDETACMRHLLR